MTGQADPVGRQSAPQGGFHIGSTDRPYHSSQNQKPGESGGDLRRKEKEEDRYRIADAGP